MIRMPIGPAARNIAASGSGMGCSSIEMSVFEAVISCNITRRVGGATGGSNARRACCKKHRSKWQWDGVFKHRNVCF